MAEEKGTVKKFSGKLKTPVVADFCRQLGTLLQAGVSLARAMNIISEEHGLKPELRELYLDIQATIRQGVPLSEALERQEGVFPVLLINMIRSGEANGTMDQTALRMADYYEKQHKLNGKVKSAMIYPKVLTTLLVFVVIFIMVYLVPQFQEIFDEMESLPIPTVILLGISDAFKNYWAAILVAVLIAWLVLHFVTQLSVIRYGLDKMKLKIPYIGGLLRKIYTARFARTLCSLYSSGIPIVLALQTSSNTIGNAYIEEQFGDIIARVRSGESLSQVLLQVDGFQKKLASSIMVGEETGNLDDMLNSIADNLDYEAERALERLVALLEPALIIVMAVIIAFVVIAVILPIYQSYATIEQGY